MKLRIALACIFTLVLSASPARAALLPPIEASSNSETGFDANILSNDLINAGQPSLSSLSATAGANFPASGSNDGTATHTNGLTYYGGPPSTGVDLLYTLNTNPGTGGSAAGYEIDSINSIYGWQDSRYRHGAQEYTVSVTTTANPVMHQIASVVYTPWAANDGAAGSSQVTLHDSTGILATGVTSIDFHLSPYGSSGDPGYTGEIGVVREFDVVGKAVTVPEPTSLILCGLSAAGLFVAVRRRKI